MQRKPMATKTGSPGDSRFIKGKAWRTQTLVVLALLGSLLGFFLVFVPNNKASLTERNFRVLGDMSDQVQDVIMTMNLSITNAAAQADDLAAESPAITNQVQNHFSNRVAQIALPLKITEAPTTNHPGGDFSCTNISIKPLAKAYVLELRYINAASNRFTIECDLNQTILPILSRPEFIDVLLVDKKGPVEFQRSQTELRSTNYVARPDLLMTRIPLFAREAETNSLSNAAGVGDLQVAGDAYKAFSRPLLVPLAAPNSGRPDWFLCGLIRQK